VRILGGVLLVIGMGGGVAWGAHHFAVTSPRFALATVNVEGAARRTKDELTQRGGLSVGKNVFSIDVAQVERALLEDPWVEEARVTRELPATIRLQIKEREAVAVLALDQALYLVTRTGEPFKKVEEADPYDLPMLTGVPRDQLARDREGALERLRTGLRVLREYERLSMAKSQVPQEVHLADDGRVTLVVGRQGTALQLGRGPWRKKLAMAERVFAKASGKGGLPGIVFLDNEAHPERVVVRMR
jgi:cell division protein FtsQ